MRQKARCGVVDYCIYARRSYVLSAGGQTKWRHLHPFIFFSPEAAANQTHKLTPQVKRIAIEADENFRFPFCAKQVRLKKNE